MTGAQILVSSWRDGVFVVDGERVTHELRGHVVKALARDRQGRPLAIVERGTIRRRDASGTWATVVEVEASVACCVASGAALYLGTDAAQIVRVDETGAVEPVPAFDHVPGRDQWYAGTAVIDGRVVGPPLGVRSLAVTCDGRVLLANVHVGGIARSSDDGRSWQPTLDIELDAHEVRAHPSDPRCVIAATAAGLCVSRDAGQTWLVERRGLHALHCGSVGFVGADLLVGCASDPFASDGAIYRRRSAGDEPLERVLPSEGLVDTRCIASHGAIAALVDGGGQLYVTRDEGRSWTRHPERFAEPSSVVLA